MTPEQQRDIRLRFVFVFTGLFGCILFLLRPDPSPTQTVFRLTLIFVGVAGIAWMRFRRR